MAHRAGVSISAVRFYERKGLISSVRTDAGHRRFHRSTIRRLSLIVVCQRLGYPLSEISDRLSDLPTTSQPSAEDWSALAADFRDEIDERIERLLALRDHLDGCIGCGCVSLDVCQLYNPEDAARNLGPGPRYLMGNTSADLPRSDDIERDGHVNHNTERTNAGWHLAQINIGRLLYPVDDPRVADFIDNLDPINALAESSPGFVWRLKDDSGNATALRGFEDPMILPNLTVWTSIEALKDYVYKSDHVRFMRRRREWFAPMKDMPVLTMWWIPAGHIPDLQEARVRVEHLAAHGPSGYAFSFRSPFEPPTSTGHGEVPGRSDSGPSTTSA